MEFGLIVVWAAGLCSDCLPGADWMRLCVERLGWKSFVFYRIWVACLRLCQNFIDVFSYMNVYESQFCPVAVAGDIPVTLVTVCVEGVTALKE